MSLLALTPQPSNEAMLGRNPDAIIEMFGVPDSTSASSQSLRFTYAGEKGEVGSFTFHHDVAISVPPEGFKQRKITRPPDDKIYSGQRVAEAALRAGNPESLTTGSHSICATYANGMTAVIVGGRVFPREMPR